MEPFQTSCGSSYSGLMFLDSPLLKLFCSVILQFGMFPVLTYPQLSTGYFHTKNPKVNSNILSLLVSITTLYYLLHINRFTSQVCRCSPAVQLPKKLLQEDPCEWFKGSLGNMEGHTVFPEDRGLLPRTYKAVNNHVWLHFQEIRCPLLASTDTHVHRCTCRQNHSYT